MVAGTTGEGAALGSVRLVGVGSASNCGGGHDRGAALVRPDISEARAAPSIEVPVTTVAGLAHPNRPNGGQNSALKCRVRHHSDWLSPHRQSEQMSEQRPHISSPPPQWVVEPTPTDISEDRAALSLVAGTSGEVAALVSVHLVGEGTASHCGGGYK